MPKAAPYRLRWDLLQGTYTLHDTHSDRAIPVAPGSQAWFDWLANTPSFTFSGQHGRLTVRQETRSGGAYWYAYRRVGEKMAKHYLGRTAELTSTLLEQVAAQLATHTLSHRQGTLASGISCAEIPSQQMLTSPLTSLKSAMSAREAVPPLPQSLHNVPISSTISRKRFLLANHRPSSPSCCILLSSTSSPALCVMP